MSLDEIRAELVRAHSTVDTQLVNVIALVDAAIAATPVPVPPPDPTPPPAGALTGQWKSPGAVVVDMVQSGTVLSGTVTEPGEADATLAGSVNGDVVTISFRQESFTGTLVGDVISGTLAGASGWSVAWSLTRATAPVPTPTPVPAPTPTPTPPPVSQGLVFSDGFETGDFSHTENGYSWGQVSGSPDSRTLDGAPVLSGEWAARFRQTSGCNVGQNRFIQLQANTSAQFLTEFGFEYFIRIPDNYAHTCPGVSTNNKWAEFYSKGARDETGIFPLTRKNTVGDGGSRLTIAVNSWRGTGEQSAVDDYITLADRGQYVRQRYWVRLGTIGQSDGQMKVWKDDRLVFQSTRMDCNGRAQQFHHFGIWQIMGFDNSGWPAPITWYVDEVRLYAGNPGW